jgi:succinyl-diaminopimelate desuccinylase
MTSNAEGLGFETRNYDGYAGEVHVGNGTAIIGVLCHIDVVEGGKGWDGDPFKPVIQDNRVYGRGSSDNKGPMLTALYAIKRLRDDGKIPDDIDSIGKAMDILYRALLSLSQNT